MNFLNLFCPTDKKHGRIWDIDEDTFYCSHHQHDEEGTSNVWTAQGLTEAHAINAEPEEEILSGSTVRRTGKA